MLGVAFHGHLKDIIRRGLWDASSFRGPQFGSRDFFDLYTPLRVGCPYKRIAVL